MSDAPIDNPFLAADSQIRSLNRARIVALGGVPEAGDLLGRTGHDLLAAASLRALIAAEAARLRLDPAAPDLIRALERRFDDPAARPHAEAIARAYGRRLGALLLMLRRGEPANRAARPEWTAAHWDFWRSVGRVYLGGGLLAGRLGQYTAAEAQDLLAAAGDSLALERARWARQLPLIGLARAAPADAAGSLLFDFGQTAVKRGVARYQGGQLRAIDTWPDAPSVCAGPADPDRSDGEVRQRWERMAAIVETGWSRVPAGRRAGVAIGISLACYLFGGHPSPRDAGCYGALQRLSPHLASFAADDLARRLGCAAPVALMHDGAAAAAAYAGAERAVVLTLGTAIGNGFPPPADTARPLAASFDLAQRE